jgi:hypothetical protein
MHVILNSGVEARFALKLWKTFVLLITQLQQTFEGRLILNGLGEVENGV